jgi:hypothetical protein
MSITVLYYLRAKEFVSGELKSDFTFIRSLRTSLCNRFIKILKTFPEDERLYVWSARLKLFHPLEAAECGEPMSTQERAIVEEFRRRSSASYAVADPETTSAKPLAKGLVKAAASGAFKNVLGVKPENVGGGTLRFISQHRQCTMHTYVSASPNRYQMTYTHDLIDFHGESLMEDRSILEWLGISSQTLWNGISADQTGPMIEALGKAVRIFVEFCEAEGDQQHG